MGTRALTAFYEEWPDGTCRTLGAMTCNWDGDPEAYGRELSAVLCMEGRKAKEPPAASLAAKFGREGMRIAEDSGEEALNAMRLLKALSPDGDRRLDNAGLYAVPAGGKSPEDRAEAAVRRGKFGRSCQEWTYLVHFKEKNDFGAAPPKVQLQVFSGTKEVFRGTPQEFRTKFKLGKPESLEKLWAGAVWNGASLASVPAGLVSERIVLSSMHASPLGLEAAPPEMLTPDVCRACAEGLFDYVHGVREENLEPAAEAVKELLKSRGASAAAQTAFAETFAAKMAEMQDGDQPRP